jgi:hypothetical protein
MELTDYNSLFEIFVTLNLAFANFSKVSQTLDKEISEFEVNYSPRQFSEAFSNVLSGKKVIPKIELEKDLRYKEYCVKNEAPYAHKHLQRLFPISGFYCLLALLYSCSSTRIDHFTLKMCFSITTFLFFIYLIYLSSAVFKYSTQDKEYRFFKEGAFAFVFFIFSVFFCCFIAVPKEFVAKSILSGKFHVSIYMGVFIAFLPYLMYVFYKSYKKTKHYVVRQMSIFLVPQSKHYKIRFSNYWSALIALAYITSVVIVGLGFLFVFAEFEGIILNLRFVF